MLLNHRLVAISENPVRIKLRKTHGGMNTMVCTTNLSLSYELSSLYLVETRGSFRVKNDDGDADIG